MATTNDGLIEVNYDLEDSSALLEKLEASDGDDLAGHLLNVEANRLSIAQSQQELQSVEEIADKVQLLDHQLDAAHRALFQMDGKALFADEVGLGKTIEVGMVLKEMVFRDAHDTFLILTPAQLATQWRREMREKFRLDFVCSYDDAFEGFAEHDRIVASIDTAKLAQYAEEIQGRHWDALVVDEAHYLRNRGTDRYEFVENIDYHYAFFATATPVQNDVTDLYNVTNLIRPGLLGTESEFERRYVPDDGGVRNSRALNRELRRVMVRHKRDDTSIDFTDRRVRTRTFEPNEREQALYDSVTDYVRRHYSKQGGQHLVMLMLQKEVVSSPWAVLGTVEKWLDGDGRDVVGRDRRELEAVAEQARAVERTTKQEKLLDVVRGVNSRMETGRTIVFTQFRATQEAIIDALEAGAGGEELPVHRVNGSLSSAGKDEQLEQFRERGGVLVTTDSISEGRNIQFCNVLVNYDLPWNPMSVEQRIGRIDRIGQDRDVYVYNLALEGTVEDYVLEKLYGKIDVFHRTVGGLKEILSEREQSGGQFEQEVLEQLLEAGSERELANNFEAMAVDLEEDVDAARKAQQFNERVFEGFEMGGKSA